MLIRQLNGSVKGSGIDIFKDHADAHRERARQRMGEVAMDDRIDYRINVLDHGFVRLVDYMGDDLSVVRAARVSYDAAWRATGKDHNSDVHLIKYLWNNRHTSPFEAVTFTFEVAAPLFVLRQWQRHRTFSYNELSARYRPLPETFYVPKPEHVGVQSADSKQGRVMTDSTTTREQETAFMKAACGAAFVTYRVLLDAGWPRELARSVLPVSTYSHMFATVNLLNLFKFLTLRTDAHAQYEIRVYAEAIAILIEPIVPVCVAAWKGDALQMSEAAE